MALQLTNLEDNGELVPGKRRYSPVVRAELEAMSGATIDRYLSGFKASNSVRGFTTTRPGPLLRNSIQIRRASDEAAAEPGFLEVDTVAHCGPTLKGEFCRSVSFTDFVTGWTQVIAIRNNARVWMLEALDKAIEAFPFPILGLDCNNGSEFINHEVVAWAGKRDIFFTRSRPYRKNDQATIESKNNLGRFTSVPRPMCLTTLRNRGVSPRPRRRIRGVVLHPMGYEALWIRDSSIQLLSRRSADQMRSRSLL